MELSRENLMVNKGKPPDFKAVEKEICTLFNKAHNGEEGDKSDCGQGSSVNQSENNEPTQSNNSDEKQSADNNIEVIEVTRRKRKHSDPKKNECSKRKKRKTVKIEITGSDGNETMDDGAYETLCTVVADVLQSNFLPCDLKKPSSVIQHNYGSNCYKPKRKMKHTQNKGELRPIFIDGSNVAYAHGKNKFFSVEGLQICIEYFQRRGHDVKAFVPNFRLRRNQSSNPKALQRMEREGVVVITPTLTINNERRIPYDDWYIVQSAALEEGIIVSRDSFQDIVQENPALRKIVEENRLIPTFVNDTLIFPADPLGNREYNFEEFLRY